MSTRIAITIIALWCFGCSTPTEDSLADNFKRNRGALEQLVTMIVADENIHRVTLDSVSGRSRDGRELSSNDAANALGLSAQRLNLYRDLLQKASAETVFKTADGKVQFYVATGGLAVSGWVAGYSYSKTTPSPIVENFKTLPTKGFVYMTIDNGWYLMKGSV